VEYQDYYNTLGVQKGATQGEIQKAFHKLAKKYHPDLNSAPEAEDRFKEINEAYEVLGDKEKRAAYDSFGENWKSGQNFTPPPDWEDIFGGAQFGQQFSGGGGGAQFHMGGGGDGFSDFFQAFFGANGGNAFSGGFGAQAQRTNGGQQRLNGRSIEANLTISLEDAFHGATRQISYEVIQTSRDGQRKKEVKSYSVQIPPGTKDGSKIRLSGQGEPGDGGGKAGDLLLKIKVAKHPLYSLKGRNILVDVPISPWQAALGGTVRVKTLSGDISLNVPAGLKSGKKFRLKGKGLPSKGGDAGDFFAVMKIENPAELSEEQRELYVKLADISGDSARNEHS
jgi:curved DNA-binding protein